MTYGQLPAAGDCSLLRKTPKQNKNGTKKKTTKEDLVQSGPDAQTGSMAKARKIGARQPGHGVAAMPAALLGPAPALSARPRPPNGPNTAPAHCPRTKPHAPFFPFVAIMFYFCLARRLGLVGGCRRRRRRGGRAHLWRRRRGARAGCAGRSAGRARRRLAGAPTAGGRRGCVTLQRVCVCRGGCRPAGPRWGCRAGCAVQLGHRAAVHGARGLAAAPGPPLLAQGGGGRHGVFSTPSTFLFVCLLVCE